MFQAVKDLFLEENLFEIEFLFPAPLQICCISLRMLRNKT